MMNKQSVINLLLFLSLLAILSFYVHIRFANSQFIREPRASFGDTHEYLEAASEPIFSETFWISIRPPVVPFLYKLVGADHIKISRFQLWFSILSWSILGLAIVSVIRAYPIKVIALIVILAFSLSEEIIMWDYIILGDSISISIIALFSASAVLLLSTWNFYRLCFLVITALLFALVRDDFTYYLLMSSILILILLFRTKFWKRILVVSFMFLILFFVSNTLSSASLRWYRPLLNTISMRILPNPQYLAYFEERGLPVNDVLLERSGKPLHYDNNALVQDLRLEEFRNWIQENGKNEYLRFLWFFKDDTLQHVFKDFELIFSPKVFYYTATRFRPIIRNARVDETLFPIRFGILLFLIANLAAAACSVIAFYEKKATWTLPLLLIFLTYPQAILVWNADANDIARHAIYHNVMLRLGVHILILFTLEFFVEKLVLQRKVRARAAN